MSARTEAIVAAIAGALEQCAGATDDSIDSRTVLVKLRRGSPTA